MQAAAHSAIVSNVVQPTRSELNVTSLVDALYSAMHYRILTGEIAPGTPLTEVSIATEYQVARPTAKAAMERLVYEGLLRRSTNKTARVPVLDADDIRDIYLNRQLLEGAVVMALAQKRLVPDTARQLVEDLRAISPDPAVAEKVDIDTGFHRSLVAALNSPRLNRTYRSLIGEAHLCMARAHGLSQAGRIADEHTAILDAIETGDPRRSVDELVGHLERACMRLISSLSKPAE